MKDIAEAKQLSSDPHTLFALAEDFVAMETLHPQVEAELRADLATATHTRAAYLAALYTEESDSSKYSRAEAECHWREAERQLRRSIRRYLGQLSMRLDDNDPANLTLQVG
jgi:hypothetical protein